MARGCQKSTGHFKQVFERRVAPRRRCAGLAAMSSHADAPGHRPASCVVTGAARGIGRGIAERLVADGHAVVITDLDGAAGRRDGRRDRGGRRAGARTCATPPRTAAVAQEALRARAPRRLVQQRRRRLGRRGSTTSTRTRCAGSWRSTCSACCGGCALRSTAFETRARGSGGDIVNTASLSGLGPVPGLSVYAATKAAVVSVTMSVAIEAPDGVGVHAILPDGVATPMVDGDGRRRPRPRRWSPRGAGC